MTVPISQVFDWMEELEITEGSKAGQKLRLEPFQRRLIRGVLGNREAAITMARGNAKTTTMSALAACFLAGPLAMDRAGVMMLASSLQQARVGWDHTRCFLGTIGIEPRISRLARWRFVDNSHHLEIQDRERDISMRCLGSDSRLAHGRAPRLILADEPSQWAANDGPRLHAALSTSLGKQADAHYVVMGTQSPDPDHFFRRMQAGGPGIYVQVYAADLKVDDPFAMRTIRKANPAIDAIPELKEEVLRAREKARRSKADFDVYAALNLNAGTPEIASGEVIVSRADWEACEREELPPREGPVAIGLDMGGARSMTAAVLYWPESGRLESFGAFPASPDLEARGLEDGIGDRYVAMRRRGELQVYPGRSMRGAAFLRDLAPHVEGHEVLNLVADRYKDESVLEALTESGLPWKIEWRGVGQGKHGSADIGFFQTEVLEGRVRSRPSLMMSSALAASLVVRDSNGNARLDKSRKRGRIDALQAAVHAVARGRRWRNPLDGPVVQRKASDYLVPDVAMQKDPERPFPISRPMVRR